jgi:hypothetical protein
MINQDTGGEVESEPEAPGRQPDRRHPVWPKGGRLYSELSQGRDDDEGRTRDNSKGLDTNLTSVSSIFPFEESFRSLRIIWRIAAEDEDGQVGDELDRRMQPFLQLWIQLFHVFLSFNPFVGRSLKSS